MKTVKNSAALMTEGPIWKKIIAFALPLFLGNLFQQLYTTADSLIVGNFLGSSSLAAVSSSGPPIFLLVGFFNGIAVGAGVIACEQRHSLTDEELEAFENLFGRIALIEWVDGKLLSTASSIAGCGPAFAAMFLESLGDAGVKHGLPRATAYRLAAQMMMGTAKLHLETGTHPGAMKDAVCSPGGTTIKGVAALEKDGFRGCVIDAIDAIEGK